MGRGFNKATRNLYFTSPGPHAGQVILSGVLPDTISNKGASPITQAPLDAYLGFHVEKGQFTTLQDARELTIYYTYIALALTKTEVIPTHFLPL